VSARGIFEHLERNGWSALDEWKQQHEPESLHLEFKQKVDPTRTPLDPLDKEKIAVALSAFANGEGGVLVYGISTDDKGIKGVPDRVQDIAPIADVARFEARVETHVNQLVTPGIDRFRLLALDHPSGDGSGVLALYVPESDGGPHRATGASTAVNDRYYMRAGTRSEPMPHGLLAERFGKRPPPKLRLIAKLDGAGFNLGLHLRLRNDGRGAARQPALQFTKADSRLAWNSIARLPPQWSIHWHKGATSMGVIYQSTWDVVVYPDAEHAVVVVGPGTNSGGMNYADIEGVIYCVDMQPTRFEAVVTLGAEVVLPLSLP
jgi:hypothetical protein